MNTETAAGDKPPVYQSDPSLLMAFDIILFSTPPCRVCKLPAADGNHIDGDIDPKLIKMGQHEYEAAMTPAQYEYTQLDEFYSRIVKPFFDRLRFVEECVTHQSGVGGSWMDTDGHVFAVEPKTFTSVPMKTTHIVRTRRDGEAKGSLSLEGAVKYGHFKEDIRNSARQAKAKEEPAI